MSIMSCSNITAYVKEKTNQLGCSPIATTGIDEHDALFKTLSEELSVANTPNLLTKYNNLSGHTDIFIKPKELEHLMDKYGLSNIKEGESHTFRAWFDFFANVENDPEIDILCRNLMKKLTQKNENPAVDSQIQRIRGTFIGQIRKFEEDIIYKFYSQVKDSTLKS